MRRLEPYELWIGNIADLADLRGAIDAGARAVVDLALNEKPPQLPRDMVYCRFPLVDSAGNDPWILASAIDTVANLIKSSVPLLVCCSAGLSRSPAIVAAALSRIEMRRPEDCLKGIAKTVPHDVSPGLWHEIFEICRSKQVPSTGARSG
ncbi:MAG TPA: dual specificity protein phosphatase, partial [Planctomycetaceae bacterium]